MEVEPFVCCFTGADSCSSKTLGIELSFCTTLQLDA